MLKKSGNGIKKIILKFYPVLILGFFWLFMQIQMKAWTGDEFQYADLLNQMSLFEVGKKYYQTWSSRILLDMLAAFTHHYPLIFFKLANTLVVVLEVLGILLLFRDYSIKMQCFVSFFTAIFDYMCFYDCGFSITSSYYIWPAMVMLYAMVLCDRYPELQTRLHRGIAIVLEIIMTLFATNMEQYLVLLLGIQMFCFVCNIREKKFNLCVISGLAASVASAIFTFTTPGKAMRIMVETERSFPEYSMLSFLQKVNMGFTTTMREYVMSGNASGVVMTCMLAYIGYRVLDHSYEKVIAFIPAIISCVYGPFYSLITSMFPYFYTTKEVGVYGVSDMTNFDQIRTWIPLFIMALFSISLLLALWLVFQKSNPKGIYQYWIIPMWILGLMSRVAMGFSPTIYSSGDRTFYPFWLTTLIVSISLYGLMNDKEKIKILYILGGLSAISVSNFMGVIR